MIAGCLLSLKQRNATQLRWALQWRNCRLTSARFPARSKPKLAPPSRRGGGRCRCRCHWRRSPPSRPAMVFLDYSI